jgi:glutaminyl-peptide cyclotransferase
MKNRFHNFICFAILTFFIFSCNTHTAENNKSNEDVKIAPLKFEILDTLSHDINAFTEGFEFVDNKLYEGTGSPDDTMKSIIGVVSKSGILKQKVLLDQKYFGEGITILKGKVYQLTYKDQLGFVYEYPSFKKMAEFKYNSLEGWGLTNDGTYLIMSDGTPTITFINPNGFGAEKTINVKSNGYGQTNVNELEYVDGFIYANVWQTNKILKIDAKNGEIVASADLSALKKYVSGIYPKSMEMNGIAYDSTTKHFYVTGKMWPKVFKLKLE